MEKENEIILYQPDASVALEVRVGNETVWLTQQQIADLFGVKQPAISKHLKNIFESGELLEDSVYSILEYTATDGKTYKTKFYNLDAILSIGYRVNSRNATLFRQWANQVLKDYLLKGYAVNQRFERLEYRMAKTEEQVGLLIKSTLPPTEGIFFEGEVFDAYDWLTNRITSAENRIIIIDPYADNTILKQLNRRKENVKVNLYTSPKNHLINLDLKKFNKQYSDFRIEIHKNYTGHDRFLIIDDTVYHIGGSIKDLGNRLMAYSILHMLTADELLAKIKNQ